MRPRSSVKDHDPELVVEVEGDEPQAVVAARTAVAAREAGNTRRGLIR
jgi:hypothetical protein